ncbi:DUF4340 domain-containing protein [Paenibacillus sp. OSY-SE]|uniref:DUF4340 domain-containing protein n=1 Tax=Paenibacillus sp. OSY-SE TaxID=1196323 RepID=UPI0002F3BFAC|nr:DUF4340 domain-containing protein [Paenibacillus sp. OSY-SE]
MKKALPTVILLLVFAVGLWYASANNFFRTNQEEAKNTLLQVNQQQITALTIQIQEEQVELVNNKGQWAMTKPDTYPINTYPVDDWLSTISNVSVESTVEEHAADMDKYGLEKPSQTFTVSVRDGKTHRINVGAESPVSGFFYATADDERTVYQVSQSALSSLARTAFDFAAKEPLTFPLERVKQFEWNWSGQSYRLQHVDKAETPTEANSDDGRSQEANKEESEIKNWLLNGKSITENDATTLMNKMRYWMTEQEPSRTASLSHIANNEPDWSLDLSLKPDQEVTGQEEKGKAETRQYKGYMQGEELWIVPPNSEWAYAIHKQELLDVQTLWHGKMSDNEDKQATKK